MVCKGYALTDFLHPCQIFADCMTILEKTGSSQDPYSLAGKKLTFYGDTQCNMANSWILAGALFGMVRWLFSTEPQVALYGLVGGLLVAGFLLPEVLGSAAGPSADFWGHVAWREGSRRSPWRRWQPWLVAAVIPVWPLLIAVVLVPAVRGREALAAVAAIAAVVAAGMLAQFAVRRRLLAGDSACALALLTLWLGVLTGLPWCRSTLV